MTGTKLWIVSELYYPEQTSTGYFLTRIAEGLSEDMHVSAVCSQPTYSEHKQHAPSRERRGGVSIYRMRSTHFAKDLLFFRALNLLTFTISTTWFALRKFRPNEKVLVVTNPPTLPPLIGAIARWKKMESYLLVHDVYPEVLSATGLLSKDSWLYRIIALLLNFCLSQFNSIIVLGRDMEKLIKNKMKSAKERVVIINNWGDHHEIYPISREENIFLEKNHIASPYIFQYSGNIGRTHDIEIIFKAASKFNDRQDIKFIFIGYGGKASLVSRLSEKSSTNNVTMLPRQPRELLGPMLSGATATIISFVEGMKGISVPSRMYNIMAAGTPIIAIAEPDSELAMAVAEASAGWVIPTCDEAGLVALISYLATPEGATEAARRGANGRAAVTERYTLPIVLDRFRSVLATEEAAGSS
jgi:glycosyltransferase involved in cell wall biosynthesis